MGAAWPRQAPVGSPPLPRDRPRWRGSTGQVGGSGRSASGWVDSDGPDGPDKARTSADTANPIYAEITGPDAWPSRVKSAILHVISLARFSLAYTRGWAANSPNSRIRLKAELDRCQCQKSHPRGERGQMLKNADSTVNEGVPGFRSNENEGRRAGICTLCLALVRSTCPLGRGICCRQVNQGLCVGGKKSEFWRDWYCNRPKIGLLCGYVGRKGNTTEGILRAFRRPAS